MLPFMRPSFSLAVERCEDLAIVFGGTSSGPSAPGRLSSAASLWSPGHGTIHLQLVQSGNHLIHFMFPPLGMNDAASIRPLTYQQRAGGQGFLHDIRTRLPLYL
jgi:hypothetical protein